MNTLGRVIKKRLGELGLSERELAQRCGMSHSYVNQLVKGRNPKTKKHISPTVGTLQKLSTGLEMSPEALQSLVLADKRTDFLHSAETRSTPQGVVVGSSEDRVIPTELWQKIKQAQDFMACIGLDPSQYNEDDWKKLLDDLKLVVESHLGTQANATGQ